MTEFKCERCGYIYDDKKILKVHSNKTYCLNCYTLLFVEEKEARTRKFYKKTPKTLIKARINTSDYNKISKINVSEFVRKGVEYIVAHPLLMEKIIGE